MTEEQIEALTLIKESSISQVERYDRPDNSAHIQAIEKVANMLTGQEKEDVQYAMNMFKRNLHGYQSFIYALIYNKTKNSEYLLPNESFLVRAIISPAHLFGDDTRNSDYLLAYRLFSTKTVSRPNTIKFLLDQKFTNDQIITAAIESQDNPFYLFGRNIEIPTLTPFGEYVISLLEDKKGILGIGSKRGKSKFIQELIFSSKRRRRNLHNALYFFLKHKPEAIKGYESKYLVRPEYQSGALHTENLILLLKTDSNIYEGAILQSLKSMVTEPFEDLIAYYTLDKYCSTNYGSTLDNAITNYNNDIAHKNTTSRYVWESYTPLGSLSNIILEYRMRRDAHNIEAGLDEYFDNIAVQFITMCEAITNQVKTNKTKYLVKCLGKNVKYQSEDYYKKLLSLLEAEPDVSDYKEEILDFAVKTKVKKEREQVCAFLVHVGDSIIPLAEDLLNGKTINHRITGALVLSNFDTPEVVQLLISNINKESNDATRNVILSATQNTGPTNADQARETISHAANRKKLNKWNEKWIIEAELPKVYWKDNGQALTTEEVRFIFYRIKQPKGLNADIEAKQIIQNIDKPRSQKFALHVLQSFIDSNADTKVKYYLTLAGMMGDDAMLDKLDRLFRKMITDKRTKVAEYVLGAIAMFDSNKALRILEVISRKYANKKRTLAAAALACLDVAAHELNITKDQLADRIIPDFGFEDQYRSFDVDGETYRAFINADFKLVYYNEDHKMRKSIPPATNKALKSELKAIEKEIRTIVKSQSGRLEKYMIEERAWEIEEWRSFFLSNPIMFVYGLKLVWGLFDADDQLVQVFYCDEDSDLYDINDDEIDLSDGERIKIFHPLQTTPEITKQWHDKLYEAGTPTIFPQTDRTVFSKIDTELDQNNTNHFSNKDVPKGADFVASKLPQLGWAKNTGDGGSLEFTKTLLEPKVTAYAYIEGPAAWFQNNEATATVHNISFIGANWKEKIKIKDIPPVWYSEVLADINALIEAK